MSCVSVFGCLALRWSSDLYPETAERLHLTPTGAHMEPSGIPLHVWSPSLPTSADPMSCDPYATLYGQKYVLTCLESHIYLMDIPFLTHRVHMTSKPLRLRSLIMGIFDHCSKKCVGEVPQWCWSRRAALIHPKAVLWGSDQDSVTLSGARSKVFHQEVGSMENVLVSWSSFHWNWLSQTPEKQPRAIIPPLPNSTLFTMQFQMYSCPSSLPTQTRPSECRWRSVETLEGICLHCSIVHCFTPLHKVLCIALDGRFSCSCSAMETLSTKLSAYCA